MSWFLPLFLLAGVHRRRFILDMIQTALLESKSSESSSTWNTCAQWNQTCDCDSAPAPSMGCLLVVFKYLKASKKHPFGGLGRNVCNFFWFSLKDDLKDRIEGIT